MGKKTRRSNEPLKRHHWKAARTARRGRFAHGILEWEDEDVAFRMRKDPTAHGKGRTVVDLDGNVPSIAWLTADKSRLKWKLQHHAQQIDPGRREELRDRLHLRF